MTQPRRLGSQYTLHERIGSGATGIVYAGADAQGRELAFKVLREDLAEQQSVISTFLGERRALTGIESPHVVQVLDLVAEGSTLAIVMDRVRGGDLRATLRQRGTLTPREVATLGEQVALGLAAVHAQGVVHRDVKPENILLDRSGDGVTAKVTDFGIAQLAETSQATRTSMMMGTINYVAPEVFGGLRATPQADVYALGVVLYELTCGVTPFQGGEAVAVMNRHTSMHPGRPEGFPAPLWDEIVRMLDKDPGHRPDAEEVADRLSRIAPAVAGSAPMQPLSEPVPGTPVEARTERFEGDTRPLTQETHRLPPAEAHRRATGGLAPGHATGAGFTQAAAGDTPSGARPAGSGRRKGRGGCLVVGLLGLGLLAAAAVGVQSVLDDEPDAQPSAAPSSAPAGPNAAPAQPSQGASPSGSGTPGASSAPSGTSPTASSSAPSAPASTGATPPAEGSMPDLLGLTVEEAKQALPDATVSQEPHLVLPWQDKKARAGEIVSQKPAPGQSASSVVRVGVAQEPVEQYLADTPQPEGWEVRAHTGDATVNGQRHPHSIRMDQLDGTLEWNLERGYRWLAFGAARTDSAPESGTKVQIEVFGDDKKLWSGKVGLGKLQQVRVDVTDVLRLRVEYTLLTNSLVSADAALTEATLYGAEGETPGSTDE